MIGNDIVDLNSARIQSNWQRERFLNKIFSQEEQSTILNSKSPFELVWLFWSMKESAYKIYLQKYQDRFFAPRKFRCHLISKTQGVVDIENETYYTDSIMTDDFIFTEAFRRFNDTTENKYFKLNNTEYSAQSETVYQEFAKNISQQLNVPMNSLYIKKNDAGIPLIYHNNNQLQVSFSMSHHGHYGAYSILKN